jgi:hypothetical protein
MFVKLAQSQLSIYPDGLFVDHISDETRGVLLGFSAVCSQLPSFPLVLTQIWILFPVLYGNP